MQMLKKIFKSDSKYYLELPDEIDGSKPAKTVAKAAKKAKNVVQDTAADVLDSKPVEKAAKTAEKAKDTAQDKLQSAQKTKDAVQDKLESASKTEVKSKDKGKSNSVKQSKPKSSPQSSGASSFEPPFWVAAMYNNGATNVNNDGTKAEQTFATENLMPVVTKYRRRPGPSLNNFKDMAKKARTPKG